MNLPNMGAQRPEREPKWTLRELAREHGGTAAKLLGRLKHHRMELPPHTEKRCAHRLTRMYPRSLLDAMLRELGQRELAEKAKRSAT